MNNLYHVGLTWLLKTSYSIGLLLRMVTDLLASFAPDTVWSSGQSPWLLIVPWTTVPWLDGCSISERDTQCVWTVSLRPWIPWACVVPETAWILMGKEGPLTEGLFCSPWGSVLCVLKSWAVWAFQYRAGCEQWGETIQGPPSRALVPTMDSEALWNRST